MPLLGKTAADREQAHQRQGPGMTAEKTFKERLESLHGAFVEAGKEFPGLKLDLLETYHGIPLRYEGWEAIRKKSYVRPPENSWDHFPDERFLARFYGNLKGYKKFEKLAGEVHALFCDTDATLVGKDGYYGWIRIVHDMARHCPSAGVRFDRKLWGHDGPLDYKARAELPDRLWTHDGMDLPVHPWQLVFDGCFFAISAAALQTFLTPYSTTFSPKDTVRFRLAPWQLAAVFFNTVVLERPASELARSGIRSLVVRMSSLTGRLDVPWFMQGANNCGTLRLGYQILYEMKATSKTICTILSKFERLGWPESIKNPLGRTAAAANAARDFVRKLKKGQTVWPRIEFKHEDNGAVIVWRVVEHPDAPERRRGRRRLT